MLAKLLVLFLSFPATAFALTIEQAYEPDRANSGHMRCPCFPKEVYVCGGGDR